MKILVCQLNFAQKPSSTFHNQRTNTQEACSELPNSCTWLNRSAPLRAGKKTYLITEQVRFYLGRFNTKTFVEKSAPIEKIYGLVVANFCPAFYFFILVLISMNCIGRIACYVFLPSASQIWHPWTMGNRPPAPVAEDDDDEEAARPCLNVFQSKPHCAHAFIDHCFSPTRASTVNNPSPSLLRSWPPIIFYIAWLPIWLQSTTHE